MVKKKDRTIFILIMIGILIILLNKGCDLSYLESNEKDRDSRGHSRLFSEWSLTSLSITVGAIIDDDCMDACEDIWLPCYDDCDALYCDDYFDCLGVCNTAPNPCGELELCRGGLIGERLACHLECGFWYAGGYDLETQISIMETYPWINDTGTEGECTNMCDLVYWTAYDDCMDTHEVDCEACQDDCYTLESGEDCDVCEDECDEGAEICIIPCVTEGEIYMWDGEPVTDLGDWFETNFPTFHEQFEEACNGLYFDGNLVSTANEYGCQDANLFYYADCRAPPLLSVEEVCETIGGTWICYADCDSVECDEPGAIITCEI